MLLSSLLPNHHIRIWCEKCGASGSVTVRELRAELGKYDDLSLKDLRRRFGECCGQPMKVDVSKQ